MNITESLKTNLSGKGKMGLIVGAVALAVSLVLGLPQSSRAQFFQSYLQAYILLLGIPGGCLVLLMIHHVAGGKWGFITRRIMEASVRTLPLMAVLFIPVLIGMHDLYHWSHADAVAHDEILQLKSPYLNSTAFIVRAIIYFAVWITMGRLLCRWSFQQDETKDIALNRPMRVLSGAGIVIYMLTISAASWDWTMSLDPHWFSSIWGPLFFVGQILTAFCFMILVLRKLATDEPMKKLVNPVHFHDLGNFTFAAVILWTYMTFSQFLIIWSANLPEEITWYLARSTTGWRLVAVLLSLFHFFVPFLILMTRHSKLNSQYLSKVVVLVLFMRLVDLFWIISPTFHDGVSVHLLDFTLPIGLIGIWLGLFMRFLVQHPVVAACDPRFQSDLAGNGNAH